MNFNLGQKTGNIVESFYKNSVLSLYKNNFFDYSKIDFNKKYASNNYDSSSRSHCPLNNYPKNKKNKLKFIENFEPYEFYTHRLYSNYPFKTERYFYSLKNIKFRNNLFNKFYRKKDSLTGLCSVPEELKTINVTKFHSGQYNKLYDCNYFFVFLVVLLNDLSENDYIKIRFNKQDKTFKTALDYFYFVSTDELIVEVNTINNNYIAFITFEFENYNE